MKLYRGVLIALGALAIATGAAVSSGNPSVAPGHRIAGIMVSVAILGLARTGPGGWIALTLALLECVPLHPVLHACLAPLIPAAILFRPPDHIAPARQRTALWWLAMLAAPLVLLQIILGAGYRHKIWGVMPHMAGAMLVAMLILVCCMLAIQRLPGARKAAVTLMSLVLAQVALGIASFLLRLLDLEATIWFTVATVLHVTNGAATLTASLLAGFVIADHAAHCDNGEPQQN